MLQIHFWGDLLEEAPSRLNLAGLPLEADAKMTHSACTADSMAKDQVSKVASGNLAEVQLFL